MFNPQDSSKADIGINVRGTFTAANRASGNIGASQGGNTCITGAWVVTKQ